MNNPVDVAVVGVSSLVGEAVLALLDERQFPVGTVHLLEAMDEAGGRAEFRGRHLKIAAIESFDFSTVRIAFFCAGKDVAAAHAERAAAAGCVVIDDSDLFRRETDVPLVVAEVNPGALAGWQARHIIANPNAVTQLMLIALKPIHEAAGLVRINAVTYQAVSGVGKAGLEELGRQTANLLNMRPIEPQLFSGQIAFNVLPQIGELQENGYSWEEMKMVWEARRILDDEALAVNPTTVRVPVFYGHCAALHVETRDKITAQEACRLLQEAPGIVLGEAPNPVAEAVGEDGVFVGRVREDISHPRGLDLWVVGDNVRKGGALNCVQIAELLVKDYM